MIIHIKKYFLSQYRRIIKLDASSTSPAEPSHIVAAIFIMEVQLRESISVHLWQLNVATTPSEYSTVGSASRDLTRVARTGSMVQKEVAVMDSVGLGETTFTSSVS